MLQRLTIILCTLLTLAGAVRAEEGLVAWYRLDEGAGATAADSSGLGNIGEIQKAKWIKVPGGYALEFDGKSGFVDCGSREVLDIRGPITMAAWVCPAWSQKSTEPGIIGKGYSSYATTMWLNSKLYFYIGDGTNNAWRNINPGRWSHIALTFDGKFLQIFLNGEMIARKPSKVGVFGKGGDFYIGRRETDYFSGMIDDVKVYNRALSDVEVAAQYSNSGLDRNTMFAEKFVPVTSGEKISSGLISVLVGRHGEVQIGRGGVSCVLNSTYSFPGEKIGWNALSMTGGEKLWKPRVKRLSPTLISIEAGAVSYRLKRTVRIAGGRVEVQDTLTNITNTQVGVMVKHRFTTPQPMANVRAGNTSDNPTIFFSQKGADFGLVAEDDIARLQFQTACISNTATLQHNNFAMDRGKSYTFRYAIYPLKQTGDVYDFINRVRADWKVNFTIEGPWKFMHAADPKFRDMGALRSYLQRRDLKVVAIMPWLDYDPGALTDHELSRDEYKTMIGEVVRKLKEVSPGIKVIGCIETDWYTIYPDEIKNGQGLLSGDSKVIRRVIDEADLPCRDSIKRDRVGDVRLEVYPRMGKTLVSLGVYPAKGNFQHKFMIDQVRFLIDEMGLDGVYIDEFNQAYPDFHIPHSYSGWDGHSADIDPETGRILRTYVDCGYVGIEPRLEIMKYVLGKKKNLTANTYSSSSAEQALPAQRFWEMQNFQLLDVLSPGKEPPFVYQMSMGLLGSPIGLGAADSNDIPLGDGLMLAIISYLRHGLLYYHYNYPDLPETGPFSGEYGPINHMFPFTPIKLHKGWVKGKERIIAARSFETDWTKSDRPKVLIFDLQGRDKSSEGKVQITKSNGRWHIKAILNDWAEVAVVE